MISCAVSECLVNIVPPRSPGKFIGLICGEPATVTIEYGCIHEHIRTEVVCADHAEMVTSGNSRQCCTPCWEVGHPCQVIGRIVVAP